MSPFGDFVPLSLDQPESRLAQHSHWHRQGYDPD